MYSLGGHTVTKLGLKVYLRVADTSLTSHAPKGGGGGGSKCRGHPYFTNTCLGTFELQWLDIVKSILLYSGFLHSPDFHHLFL